MFVSFPKFFVLALFWASPVLGKESLKEIPVKRLLLGKNGVDQDGESFFMVKNQDEWKKVSSEILGNSSNTLKVDFKTSQVLVVHSGQRSGGYSLSVKNIEIFDSKNPVRVKVNVVLTNPGENCMTTSALEGLYEAIAIPVKYSIAQVLFAKAQSPSCK
jgi:hypothetical protein